ncbi:MAG: hypothetical protein EBS35_01035 [Bacteroidetes bacterium]|nr:hypothetical protein [Bacteroidota bacterium]
MESLFDWTGRGLFQSVIKRKLCIIVIYLIEIQVFNLILIFSQNHRYIQVQVSEPLQSTFK